MAKTESIHARVSYWRIFRLIFVFFSLYCLKEVFYEWDGFSYYASISEFLPSVGLLTIYMAGIELLIALVLWIPIKLLEWSCSRIKWSVRSEHLMTFVISFIILSIITFLIKKIVLYQTPIPYNVKIITLLVLSIITVILTIRYTDKMEQFILAFNQRITPLVWIFGLWTIISIPLVAYSLFAKQNNIILPDQYMDVPLTDIKRPNIILVTFDALTARNMSVYGYDRPTTPFISKWAENSIQFNKLQAESNFTTPTVASLMTGKRLWTHKTYQLRGSKPLKSHIESLPLELKRNGYYNMAFVANPAASVKVLGISNGFDLAPNATWFVEPKSFFGWSVVKYSTLDTFLYDLIDERIRRAYWIMNIELISKELERYVRDFFETSVPPKKAFDTFFKAIDGNIQRPLFAWIHLFPPHDPYLPPEPYMGMFNSSSDFMSFKSQTQIIPGTFDAEMRPTIEILRDRYDEFIRYCDKEFEHFINKLSTYDEIENTIIIFSSDHGESFQHNFFGHNGPNLYEQVTNIPLIIKMPNQTKGQVINNLVEQIDIAPTILDLAGARIPSWMEGRSLVPLMSGKDLPSLPVFSMYYEENPSMVRITKGTLAVWMNNYKLIHYLEQNKSLLFDLNEDPDELDNLFYKEPSTGRQLLNILLENLNEAQEK